MQTLTNDQLVKLAAWDNKTAAHVGTLPAMMNGAYKGQPEKAAEMIAACRARREQEVWVSYTGATMTNSMEWYAHQEAAVAAAAIIEDGEVVEIEGNKYQVFVMNGCADRPKYSDPIKFIQVEGA